MDFELTEEQRDFQKLAHDFAEREMRPVAAELDEKEEMPWEVLKKAQRIGLLSYFYPEEYGGGGMESVFTHGIIGEELSWGCAGITTAMGGCSLAATPILAMGTEEQKAKYVPLFCDPEKVRLGAFALTEPEAGSDVAGLRTTAERKGDRYIINGTKCFITNGGIADLYVVFASTDRSRGSKGISAFIVPGDAPGISLGKKEHKMGVRCSHTGMIHFDNVSVPAEDLLGQEGKGFIGAMQTFDRSRNHVGAAAVGVARAAFEVARDYAKERVQFGKPIIQQQAIGFMLADMATRIDAARLLNWHSAWLADKGLPCTKETSMAKAFATDMAMEVATNAVQVLGGYGYMREYPLEKWMRDVKIMQIYEGTNQIQRLVIVNQL
ncbi:MAG: acyl-CoA dehydrogenase [Chloroflexota bacterium]|nr:MAG: acyl-CoA dehydrogenase [Chloroflexota bacterium]